MTAAERAAEVIYAMLDDEHAVVACLMANPALLVDLAIEAGGLVEDEAVEVFCDHVGGCRESGCDLNRKVFRRTTQEADQ